MHDQSINFCDALGLPYGRIEDQQIYDATEYLVEGESFEVWQDNARDANMCPKDRYVKYADLKWEQICEGRVLTCGHFKESVRKSKANKKGYKFWPVNVSIHWARVEGHLVGFWHAISMVVNYEMIEKFLNQTFGNVKYRTDATNFHNVRLEIKRENEKQNKANMIKNLHPDDWDNDTWAATGGSCQ